MTFFQQKKTPDLHFTTRAEAFNYMLAYMMEEKKADPLEAAKQANEFAEIFAKNMGIPLKIEPDLKGVDKYISAAEKIGNYIETHPKVVEYGIPAITFIAGLFTGKKVEDYQDRHDQEAPKPQEPLDFDKIPD